MSREGGGARVHVTRLIPSNGDVGTAMPGKSFDISNLLFQEIDQVNNVNNRVNY